MAVVTNADDLTGSTRGAWADRLFAGVARAAGGLVLVVLVYIVVATTSYVPPCVARAGAT